MQHFSTPRRALIFWGAGAILALVLFLHLNSWVTSPARATSAVAAKPAVAPDHPGEAQEFEASLTRDPATGRVPRQRLVAAQQYATQLLQDAAKVAGNPLTTATWTERGPTNVGGRVRAILLDPADASGNTIWVGTAGGGLWKTTNGTSSTPTWVNVNGFLNTLAVSTLAADPTNPGTFYAGTGEGYYNGDAISGAGIWKTTDRGVTWTQLSSTATNTFALTQKLAVTASGVVYAATHSGIWRSLNQGATWTKVLGAGTGASVDTGADIEIAADGTLFATLGLIFSIDGIYRSTTGAAGSWTKLNTLAGSGLPTTGYNRIELACAPSDANRIYAVFSQDPNTTAPYIFRSSDKGTTWQPMTRPGATTQDPSFNPGSSWYSLTAAVSPVNPNVLFVGVMDVYRATAAATDPVVWTKVSAWNVAPSNTSFVHADNHIISFIGNSPAQGYIGNDGGVFYSSTLNAAVPTFASRNQGLNITQFYTCAVHPTLPNYFLAGTQDNGTQKFSLPGTGATTDATGGDGGFCFIDQNEPQYQFTSYIGCYIWRSTNGGASFPQVAYKANRGSFINPADYDSRTKTLYGGYKDNFLFRWLNATTASTSSTDSVALPVGSGSASHVTVSPNTPGRVFVGTGSGRVLRVDNAHTASPSAVLLRTGVGSVSCVAVERGNDNHLLLTYSNYGVVSVWETINGGSTWRNVEGNLPDMPVRWALFDPTNNKRALLATELGVWGTEDLSSASVGWQPAGNAMRNTRVDMLRLRPADNQVVAATHGRGLFTSNVLTVNSSRLAHGASPGPVRGLYPNPFTQDLTLTFTQQPKTPITLTLFDAQGRRIHHGQILGNSPAPKWQLPTSLAPGLYTIRTESGGVQQVFRVVRQ